MNKKVCGISSRHIRRLIQKNELKNNNPLKVNNIAANLCYDGKQNNLIENSDNDCNVLYESEVVFVDDFAQDYEMESDDNDEVDLELSNLENNLENENTARKLQSWSQDFGISQRALDNLIKILNTEDCEVAFNSRALHKTPPKQIMERVNQPEQSSLKQSLFCEQLSALQKEVSMSRTENINLKKEMISLKQKINRQSVMIERMYMKVCPTLVEDKNTFKLPIESLKQLQNLETQLTNPVILQKFIKTLDKIKGNGSLTGAFRNILSDSVVGIMNYDGTKGKFALKNFPCFCEAIYESSKQAGIEVGQTEKEIRNAIRLCKNRLSSIASRNRQKTNNYN